MSAQLSDISTVSRLDLAMRTYTTATARLRSLEQEATAAFREYHAARQRLLEEHGVTADVELDSGISAAYSVYKQELARADGRIVARADA